MKTGVKRDIYGTYIEQWVISTFSAQLSFVILLKQNGFIGD